MNKLRILRKKNNLTQRQVAEFCKVTPHCIHNIETGKRNLSVDKAMKIAEVLKINWYDLYQ